ncbi:unnamed protein product [Pleuronectes platessa]|uniref:Uncharacterized protein n=1 Tax=Pleuronectes platessa TaxID=8262 RepID=A0A9N7W1L6_PLEPL|nr:unnamed protein product [Pleuronectes platessa]
MATTPSLQLAQAPGAAVRQKHIQGGGAVGDWRGGEWRQTRLETWQSQQKLILDSGEKEGEQQDHHYCTHSASCYKWERSLLGVDPTGHVFVCMSSRGGSTPTGFGIRLIKCTALGRSDHTGRPVNPPMMGAVYYSLLRTTSRSGPEVEPSWD